MNRQRNLERLAKPGRPWDILIVGGGATGLGVAVDAAARGYRTALVEQSDFAKGTSSRSTKLAHGGVRYLRSGEVGLVRGALRERGLLARNAPHLVRKRGFVIPVYRRLDLPIYGFGLKAYERLSGQLSFGASRRLSVKETQRLLPTVRTDGLRGGVLYYDGQFDDARLALALARTADDHGATVVNYARVESLRKENDRITGAVIVDQETGRRFDVKARAVVNATGIFTDELRRLDDAAVAPMLSVSSGVHLTLDRRFLPGEHAIMIPRTSDGRVLFAVPWLDHVILGTTDEPRDGPELEPRPLESEIAFLIENANQYLAQPVARADVLSIFTGLRPLVRKGKASATKSLSRDHVIVTSPSGLVTVTGGKWTSYRKMAEDTVDSVVKSAALEWHDCITASLPLHGAGGGVPPRFARYGHEADELEQLIAADATLDRRLHPRLDLLAVEVIWAARHEMARTLDDMLARRSRALALDARAALEIAPEVARLLARELGQNKGWIARQLEDFALIAAPCLPEGHSAIASNTRPRIMRPPDQE